MKKLFMLSIILMILNGCVEHTQSIHQKILSYDIYTVCASGQEFIHTQVFTAKDGDIESIQLLRDKDNNPKQCNY